VSALGEKFGMSIYAVNLTELNDRTLKTAIGCVPGESIILFEDIDCMKAGNRRSEQGDSEVVPGRWFRTRRTIRQIASELRFRDC